MGQRCSDALLSIFQIAIVMFALLSGCEKRNDDPGADNFTSPRVVSLVPAATDLIVGMGAADHLVAISNYDVDRPETAGRPRVGDYENIDWERIHSLKPDVMIIFQAPDRITPGMKQQVDQLGVKLVNVRTETLEDLFNELTRLGELLDESAKAKEAAAALRKQLDAVRDRVKDRPRVRALIVRDEKAQGVVGQNNFLNDLLVIAGGENLVQQSGWPSVDREALIGLKPDAVLHLLSAAAPHVEASARNVWRDMPQLPAVQNNRVTIINEWYSQQPGYQVGKLAEQFADALHPSTPSGETR